MNKKFTILIKTKKVLLPCLVMFSLIFSALPIPLSQTEAQGDVVNVRVTQTESKDFPEIQAYVSVEDENGNTITGLTADNFEVTEQSNLESQPITEQPIDVDYVASYSTIVVALSIDRSGSMSSWWGRSKMDDAKDSAKNFLELLHYPEGDRAAIVSFAYAITINQPFTSDKNNLINAVHSLSAGGNTALYDAIYTSITENSKETGVKAVIVFTDGRENSSNHSKEEVISHANNNNIPVYTIGLGSDVSETSLKDIAISTHAFYTYAPQATDLDAIYNDIAEKQRGQYLVAYTTHNPNFDGTTRTVTVKVTAGGNSSQGTNTYFVPPGEASPQMSLTPETQQLMTNSQFTGQGLEISATITDDVTVQEAKLFYRTTNSGQSYKEVLMDNPSGDIYQYTIPGSDVEAPGLDFYLTASDGTYVSTEPKYRPSLIPHQIAVLPNHKSEITHSPITESPVNTSILIEAEIVDTDDSDYVDWAKLYYRRGGHILYQSVDMSNPSGNTWQITIPADVMTEDGIDYYIVASDSRTVKAYHGTDVSPHHITTDTVPPERFNGQPAGELPSGTTEITISLETNENAVCKYATSSDVSFDLMSNTFITTGGISHIESITGLSDGVIYNYYVRCQDEPGNANTDDFPISFSIEKALPENEPLDCTIELQNDNGDKIDEINVGESFNIYVGDSTGDISQVRFLSDESQNGEADENCDWTDPPFSWNESGDTSWGWHWDHSNKKMEWSFDSPGEKEVWVEIKNNNSTSTRSANISVFLSLPEWEKDESEKILPVPYYSQGNTSWCVPTSMAMILKYYEVETEDGKPIHSWDIAKEWGWGRDIHWWELWDTMPWNIKSYFEKDEKYRLDADEIPIDFDAIMTAIDNKSPVLLSFTYPVNHAVVVVGYSNVNGFKQIYISDPSGKLLCDSLNLCQKLIAVPVPWDCIPMFSSHGIAVSGNPNPPKGTLDIDMTGSNGFYFTQDDLQGKMQRVHSWAYGKDDGMGWRFTNNHPLTLNEKDQFKFDRYITNHTENEQMYQIEINFVKDGYSFPHKLPEPINIKKHYRQANIMQDTYPLKDLLGENYGEYTIILTLIGEENGKFAKEYDKITFPMIEYTKSCGNGVCDCEQGETFEKCYQDCAEEGIEKYFPYWHFSKDEKYYPTSFYFDNDADVENNPKHYFAEKGDWDKYYVYIHTVEDDTHFTIQYWLYSVFNEHQDWPEHDHDWDATIFIVFDKNDFREPEEVRFARHYFIGDYSWSTKDEEKKIEKIGDHVIAYVAEGSHGAYISKKMMYGDKFSSGGRLLRPNFSNWYKVGDCSEETIITREINGQERTFCEVENKFLGGKVNAQNKPMEGYWPNYFVGFYGEVLEIWGEEVSRIGDIFQSPAPWGTDRWSQTKPTGLERYLEFLIACPVDLHVYDSEGRHIGMNYETGKPEIQIPDAIYLKKDEKQYILIPNPSVESDYKIEIIGLDTGDYNFKIMNAQDIEDGETIIFTAADVPTTAGSTHQYTIDWDVLSQGGEGTILKIDLDGDGDFEEIITTGDIFQPSAAPEAPEASTESTTDDEPNQSAYTAPSGGGGLPQGLSISGSSIATSAIKENTTAISWLTSLFSTSRVIYSSEDETHNFDSTSSFNYGYAHSTEETSTKATGHHITLYDLYPGATYYYRCISASVISPEHSFITSGEKMIIPLGDINRDGKVDILDFNLLVVNWGDNPENQNVDFNSDGKIDILDFNTLIVNWI